MKKPEIKILPLAKNSPVHFVLINGDTKYKCLDKDRAEAIEGMIDALIEMRKLWHNECWEFAYGETKGDAEEAQRHADNNFYVKMIDKALEKAGVTEL